MVIMTAGSCCRSSFLISKRNPEDSLVPYDNYPSLCSREIYAYRQFQPQKSGTCGNPERETEKRFSSLVLDKTKTAMGARTLRSYVEQPLIDRDEIEQRLEALEELNKNGMLRDEIREYLGPVYDLERLISRISYKICESKRSDRICFFAGNASLYKNRF